MSERNSEEEFKRLRLTPLNRVAALKLKEAEVECHPAIMPVFRLMEWELFTGRYPTHIRTARELLRLRHMRDQNAALSFLLENCPGGVQVLQRRLLCLPPHSAAQELLDVLETRIGADPANPFPGE